MWRKWLVLCLIWLILFQPLTGYTQSVGHANHIVVIVVPGLSFLEVDILIDTEEELWEKAAMAAMNVRPEGPYSYLNNMVTIGAGRKAVGVQDWNSYEDTEYINSYQANDWMYQLSGHSCSNCLVHPLFHRLVDKNRKTSYKAIPGLFGQWLEDNDIKTQVYGNSDTDLEQVRYASMLTMNMKGYTTGELIAPIIEDQKAPFSKSMNQSYLIDKVTTYEGNQTFTVIEWGDLHRLFSMKPQMERSHFTEQLNRSLKSLSQFVKAVVNDENEVWLFSPMMHQEAYDLKYQLAPLFYWSSQNGGTLTSETTRQNYLVSSVDLLPTWVKSFNGAPDMNWIGQPIKIVENEHVDKQNVLNRVEEIVLIYKHRAAVISIYVTILVMALIVSAIFGWMKPKRKVVWQAWNRVLLLASLLSPFWFLLLTPIVKALGVIGFVIGLTAITFLSGWFLERFSKNPIPIIGGLTAAIIAIDLYLGTPLMHRSFLGYDPIIGARYYGIGNEYVGVFMIAVIMLLSPLLKKKSYLVLIYIGVIALFSFVLLGNHSLGTNAGAALSCAIAFSFLIIKFLNVRIRKRLILIVGLFAAVGLLGLFFYKKVSKLILGWHLRGYLLEIGFILLIQSSESYK
ncbi:hypothetical protein [Bacillus sp. JCM 19034]|uniref:hypothetical protein n=1 Tax=Bacillus sp. JCM 19034 TaxID=1481928 RepID=UPI0007852813|nr:hypothetical protein [Bacillus sp. JCM 19034]